ncbi:hypothetical protein [Qipengyuania sp. MTN3-11]|uniref:hypothetical protein n=1 Tax=Qipengyuania sp. MTN3-11 TaxID=3056557 RepID=UPI0036F40503
MHTDGEEVHVSETEASGGSKEGVVRWVLIFGTILAILLLSAIWIFGAASQGDVEEEATVSGSIQSAEDETAGDDTDSLVGIDGDETEGEMGDVAGDEGPDAETPLDTVEN